MTTTTRLLITCAALILLPASAGASWMGNFDLAHAPGSYLPHGEHATITFDYDIDEPAGVRFRVAPMNGTSVMGGFIWSGSAVYGPGTGSHTTWWSFPNDAEATHYRIQMVSTDWTTTILEIVIPAWYTFGANAVYNVEFSHTSPTWFARGGELTVSMDGMTDEPDGAWVYARPFTDGALSPGYGALGGFIPYGGGSDSHWFRFQTLDADVDEVRIRMVSVADGTDLLEFFIPVEYHWRDHGFANLVLDPPPPALLPYGMPVIASYEYLTTEPGDVRTWAVPYLNGFWYFDGWYQGSGLLPPPSGPVSRSFGITSPGTFMNQIAILMNDASATRIFEATVPAEYTYADHALWNPVWDIAGPAALDLGERVTVDIEYSTTDPGGVRVFCVPIRESGGGNYTINPSALHPTGSGTASVYFALTDVAGRAEGLRIWMTNADQSVQLAEIEIPADHFFGAPGFSTETDEVPEPRIELSNWPNPFNPQTSISVVLPEAMPVQLQVFGLDGGLVRTLHDGELQAGPNQVVWNGTDTTGAPVSSGTYIYRVVTPDGALSRRMVLIR